MKNAAPKPLGSANQQTGDDTPPKQPKSLTDPPEIKALQQWLTTEKDLGGEMDKHNAIVDAARSEIEILVTNCDPTDATQFIQLTGRIGFAEQCLKFLSLQRDSARKALALAFEPSRKLVTRNLRLIGKTLIGKEMEALKERYSDEQKRRTVAADADAPTKAKARAERFEWSTKVDPSELREGEVNPEVAQRVLDFWGGVKTELTALGVEPWTPEPESAEPTESVTSTIEDRPILASPRPTPEEQQAALGALWRPTQ
jgi:hypothetical protein